MLEEDSLFKHIGMHKMSCFDAEQVNLFAVLSHPPICRLSLFLESEALAPDKNTEPI
jgi:hypothetical protein